VGESTSESGWQSAEGFIARPGGPRLPSPPTRIAFSLFDRDLVNRAFGWLGLRARRNVHLIGRGLVLAALTWGITALLAQFVSHVGLGRAAGENFFLDVAAYLQFLVGLPLFVVAERIIGGHTREAAGYFLTAGIVPAADLPLLEALHRHIERLRTSPWPEVTCLALAYVLAIATISPQTSNMCPTWHTTWNAEGAEPARAAALAAAREAEAQQCARWLEAQQAKHETGSTDRATSRDAELRAASPNAVAPIGVHKALNAAGWWEMLVALPILNFWWLRWIWKIGLWSWYLFRLSRLPLALMPSHPDTTGGIGFISDVQTKFGLAILAYGISNIASTIGYKVSVEHAPWSLHSVWGPLLGFVLGAPLLFTLPLFMFTKQLYRVKKRAREELYERLGQRSRAFEAAWQKAEPGTNINADLVEWQQLRSLYDHVEKMRIVPFDLRSFAELLGQTLGALIPLLGYLNLPEPILGILERGSKMIR
jgi:hypothetical protein